MRVLFTTAPLSGHFFPLVPLAWACRSLGHEVMVATSDSYVPTALRSGLPVTSSGPAVDFADQAKDAVHGSPAQRRRAHGQLLSGIAARNLPGLASVVDTWRPDLVVSERAEFAGPIVAAAHEIPQVEMRWGVAPLTEFRTAAAAELHGHLTARGLHRLPEPDLVLSPWPRSLRLPHAMPDENIRFVPFNGDGHIPRWLLAPRSRPRLCVTLGTVLPRLGTDGVWNVVLRALDLLPRTEIEVLVAVDEDLGAGVSWPANVRHAGRMPLAEVLANCDGALHHGGQGTSLTALAVGCPQLVVPQFDDHFENADAVVRAGAGIRLSPDEFTSANLAKATLRLVESVDFKQCAQAVAGEIEAQPSPVEVVGALEAMLA